MDAQSTERAETAARMRTTKADPTPRPMAVIVVERRDFFRGCLKTWLEQFGQEFQPVAVASVEPGLADGLPEHAGVALIGVSGNGWADRWLHHQVEWLHKRLPTLPIALLIDTQEQDEAATIAATARHLGVQGCLTTSTSLTVAAAALRLVLAGGHYFPTISQTSQSLEPAACAAMRPATTGERFEKLTPRELAVLSVLAVGAQNKIIAFRLGMSMSTVKAHMHSIIRKLRVRNRTEAVVAARALELTQRADPPMSLRQAA